MKAKGIPLAAIILFLQKLMSTITVHYKDIQIYSTSHMLFPTCGKSGCNTLIA